MIDRGFLILPNKSNKIETFDIEESIPDPIGKFHDYCVRTRISQLESKMDFEHRKED